MLYSENSVTLNRQRLCNRQRGSVMIEVVTVALAAVLGICSISCLLAQPVQGSFVVAAESMGGSTEGTKN